MLSWLSAYQRSNRFGRNEFHFYPPRERGREEGRSRHRRQDEDAPRRAMAAPSPGSASVAPSALDGIALQAAKKN